MNRLYTKYVIGIASTFLFVLLMGIAGAPQAAPAINAVAATPNVIPSGVPYAVTISASIEDPSVISSSVNVVRVDQNGKVIAIVGTLKASGGGGYTGQLSFAEEHQTEIRLQISAAFKGVLKRVLSSQFSLIVTQEQISGVYPAGWQVDVETLKQGGPTTFTNFRSAYLQGGIVPTGGAEIVIAKTTLTSEILSDVIDRELMGTNLRSQVEVTIGGSTGEKVSYSADFTPTFSMTFVTAYVPHGSALYKFFLRYNSNDVNEQAHLAAFEQLLNSVQFAQ